MAKAPKNELEQKWQSLLTDIRQILMRDWHPIGAAVPDDEYDTYAHTITDMLLRDCSALDIAEYLAGAERQILGDTANRWVPRAKGVDALINPRAALNGHWFATDAGHAAAGLCARAAAAHRTRWGTGEIARSRRGPPPPFSRGYQTTNLRQAGIDV